MGKSIKTVLLLFVLIAIIQLFSLPVGASTLNVPSDFPGNFRMDLLAWNVFIDQPADNYSWPDATVNPVEGYIDFSATSFNGDGDPNWGTSTLSSTADYVELATSVYYGLIWQFFINGTGTGLITDNGDGTGDWELTIPTLSLVEGIADVPLVISMEDLTLSI